MPYEQTGGFGDFGFLPPDYRADVQAFTTGDNAQGSQKWNKPKGVSMCYIFAVGGGGGGGGGLTGATTTARGGGGGGGSACNSMILTPAIFLPDSLNIQVASGGQGFGSGSFGGTGGNTFVGFGAGVTAISAIPNLLLIANGGGGGAPGATTGNAAGGTAGSNSNDNTIGHSSYRGFTKYNVGFVGATGGLATAGAAGSSFTGIWNVGMFSGGTGGGSVSAASTGFAGGSLTLQAAMDWSDGSLLGGSAILQGGAGSSGGAAVGNAGIMLWKPFLVTGGTGGGSTDNAAGGAGGNGGIGCGGGGGGAGTTGGKGGNGGDGLVVIISW